MMHIGDVLFTVFLLFVPSFSGQGKNRNLHKNKWTVESFHYISFENLCMIHMKSDERKSLFEISQIIGIKVQTVFQQRSAEIKQT